MDIIIRARNCDITNKTKTMAQDKVEHATRFFDRVTGLEVAFSQDNNPEESAIVEITARTKGHTVRAVGTGDSHPEAVDKAVSRFERQLRRYKSKLVDSRKHGGDAKVPVVAPEPKPEPVQDPVIVRRKSFELVPMAPADAVLQLELIGHDFFLFVNKESNLPSVVYHRDGGDVGLIEGEMAA